MQKEKVILMKKLMVALYLSVLLSIIFIIPALTVCAESPNTKILISKGPLKQINEYFSTQSITYNDGTILDRSMIKGPPKPPPGHLRPTVLLPEPLPKMGINTLQIEINNFLNKLFKMFVGDIV